MDKKEYGQRKLGVSKHGGKGTGRGKPFSDARKGGEGRSYSSGDKFGKNSRSDGGRGSEGSDRGTEGGFGERRSYGEKKSFGEKRSYGEGRSYGDKKSFGEKREYGQSEGFREKRGFEKERSSTGRSFDKNLKRPQRVPVKFEHPAKSEHPAKDEAPVPAKIGEEKDGFVETSEETEDRIEGRNPVLEAFKSGRPINKLYIEKDSEEAVLLKIAAMAREKAVPVQYVDRRKLDLMSKTRIHQGVILEVAAHEYAEVEDMLALAEEKGEKPFLLVLDGITDTNNFGSVIRTAECAGVHGIIIPKRRSVSLNATVAKVAAGAQEYVPIARVTNLVQTLTELKEKGLWIIGSDMEGEKNYYDADLKGPIALVIGNEGEGMSRVVSQACDFNVRIPLKGTISSLNAGVAAGLILFEIAKQRG